MTKKPSDTAQKAHQANQEDRDAIRLSDKYSPGVKKALEHFWSEYERHRR